MKRLCFLIMLIFQLNMSFAAEVKVEINPPKPIAGEVFQIYFKIQFDDNQVDPVINFSPYGLEVVDKANQGFSTRTIYANGKLSVTREATIVYDMVANKPGPVSLRDISVQLGGKTLKHSLLSFNVLKEAPEVSDIFVMAEVPKKDIYVGEGIVARYYIYSKLSVTTMDIKKYPNLNGFLKRFLQDRTNSEYVSVDGERYMRSLIYSAKLFPEKPGDLKIDPIHVTATYAPVSPNDPFSRFGLGRNLKTKTLSSETIKINVKPVPLPTPDSFIGLVGKHDIQIQFGKSRLIINEPLEIKLTVSGGGALENLEAPQILKNDALEEFESNGDLKITNSDLATKTFDYTFLAKLNVKIPSKSLTLSYFDPQQEKYIPVNLNIPEIVVAGGAAQSNEEPRSLNENKISDALTPKKSDKSSSHFNPLPLVEGVSGWKGLISYLNTFLLFISIFALVLFMAKGVLRRRVEVGKINIPKKFKTGNFTSSEFIKWLGPKINSTGKSPAVLIKESNLSDDAKNYFLSLLKSLEAKEYSASKVHSEFTYRANYFKDLARYLTLGSDEDN